MGTGYQGDSAEYAVRLRPQWKEIELIRSSVGLTSEVVLHDAAGRDTISMISAELLENAVKYGDLTVGPVEYSLRISTTGIDVAVSNWCSAGQNLDKLRKLIDSLAGYEDPHEAYVARMQEIFNAGAGGESGLGLVRIAYEGPCELSVDIDDSSQQVRVMAHLAHQAPPGDS